MSAAGEPATLKQCSDAELEELLSRGHDGGRSTALQSTPPERTRLHASFGDWERRGLAAPGARCSGVCRRARPSLPAGQSRPTACQVLGRSAPRTHMGQWNMPMSPPARAAAPRLLLAFVRGEQRAVAVRSLAMSCRSPQNPSRVDGDRDRLLEKHPTLAKRAAGGKGLAVSGRRHLRMPPGFLSPTPYVSRCSGLGCSRPVSTSAEGEVFAGGQDGGVQAVLAGFRWQGESSGNKARVARCCGP